MNHLAGGNLGFDADPDAAREDGSGARGAPALADASQRVRVRQPLGEPKAARSSGSPC